MDVTVMKKWHIFLCPYFLSAIVCKSFFNVYFFIVPIIIYIVYILFITIKRYDDNRTSSRVLLLSVLVDYCFWIQYCQFFNLSSYLILFATEAVRVAIIIQGIRRVQVENRYFLLISKAIIIDWMIWILSFTKSDALGILPSLGVFHPLYYWPLFFAALCELYFIAFYVVKLRYQNLPQAPGAQYGVPRWLIPWK